MELLNTTNNTYTEKGNDHCEPGCPCEVQSDGSTKMLENSGYYQKIPDFNKCVSDNENETTIDPSKCNLAKNEVKSKE